MTSPSVMLDMLRIRLEPHVDTGIVMPPALVRDITNFLGQVAELSRGVEAMAETKAFEKSLRAMALAFPEHSNVVLLRPSTRKPASSGGDDAA